MKNILTPKPIKRFEFLEVVVDAGLNLKQKFADSDTLRGKKIYAIDVYPIAKVSKSPGNAAIVNAVAFAKSFLVLVTEGIEGVNRIPLIALDPTNNGGLRMAFDGIVIDFPKSYVSLPDNAGMVAGEAYLFGFYFDSEETGKTNPSQKPAATSMRPGVIRR